MLLNRTLKYWLKTDIALLNNNIIICDIRISVYTNINIISISIKLSGMIKKILVHLISHNPNKSCNN